PDPSIARGPSAVCFLWHFPSRERALPRSLVPRRYLAACPVEPGLSSNRDCYLAAAVAESRPSDRRHRGGRREINLTTIGHGAARRRRTTRVSPAGARSPAPPNDDVALTPASY